MVVPSGMNSQKDAFPVPRNRGHDFPSGQCLLKLPGFGFEGDRG
jgi:hypothetical protein